MDVEVLCIILCIYGTLNEPPEDVLSNFPVFTFVTFAFAVVLPQHLGECGPGSFGSLSFKDPTDADDAVLSCLITTASSSLVV